ncbi:MAG: paraslipin [Candidatus Pacearchaeota archaeon]|nr:paraslipin [Candidatus Pacearchaeota archaeon]
MIGSDISSVLFIIAGIAVGGFGFYILSRMIRIVPAQTAMVIERLGKYIRTIGAGFHILIPLIDKVRYKHNLKERAIDVPVQPCITKDNIRVEVDGILYLKVVDPKKASYGINKYLYATRLLAQTTMRSVIGKLDMDKSFEERDRINAQVVKAVDEASDPWGVKVTRYEIKNITVPRDILSVMEVQMGAERIKRALIATSEGEMQSRINYSMGIKQEAILRSEGEKQRLINESEGKAREIEAIAKATALGISNVAEALEEDGGDEAVALRIAEEYIGKLKNLAKANTKVILPLDLGNMNSFVNMIRGMLGS